MILEEKVKENTHVRDFLMYFGTSASVKLNCFTDQYEICCISCPSIAMSNIGLAFLLTNCVLALASHLSNFRW